MAFGDEYHMVVKEAGKDHDGVDPEEKAWNCLAGAAVTKDASHGRWLRCKSAGMGGAPPGHRARQAEEPAWIKTRGLEKPQTGVDPGRAAEGVTWGLPTQKSSGARQHKEGGQASRPSVRDPESPQPRGAWPGSPSVAQGGNPAGAARLTSSSSSAARPQPLSRP